MPRINYPYKPPSKGTMRVRVHRSLKRIKEGQSERLRTEGDASTSYSALVRTQPEEPMVFEGLVYEGGPTVQYGDQPETGNSDEEVDDITFLRRWVSQHNVPQATVSSLLCHLRKTHQGLPLDPRTLMNTPRITDLRSISPGKYGHYGLRQALERIAPNPVLHAAEYDTKPVRRNNHCR
ncbi:unnamed protein product [Calicophoron daubneyi]|uniref:Uncharacterized protein n=1 Tax=Calicophoron daubneyi TaxID=300641 RepID=A0AAV2T4V7_CALDB